MRGHVTLVSLVFLIAPAWAGAQDTLGSPPDAAASTSSDAAPAPAVAALLRSLPLRAEEMKAAGLPEALPQKPAMFIDRMTLKKQSPEKPDEVHASLRIVGFVLRE